MGGIVRKPVLPSERGGEVLAPIIVIEGPDGRLHGNGNIVVSADASQWRPQDMTPRMRQIISGQ